MPLDRDFWAERYAKSDTGWDLGGPSTPLREYIDQLKDKSLRILIPGGGRAYEAEHAFRKGLSNVFVIDLTGAPFDDLLQRCPEFPRDQLITGDFFDHNGSYDRILEQTFFCAIDPALREKYVTHMNRLLKPGGRLIGVLFDDPLNTDHPPFGGSLAEYIPLFSKVFKTLSIVPCYNSIKPREGREVWLRAVKGTEHRPIDCNLYDRYEAAATLKQSVKLKMRNGEEHRGIIVDLLIHDGIEWLLLGNGIQLRLDAIAEMNVLDDR